MLLYATTDDEAREERIEVRPPGKEGGPVAATVILRPVRLPRMAGLVGAGHGNGRAAERQGFARALIAGGGGESASAGGG